MQKELLEQTESAALPMQEVVDIKLRLKEIEKTPKIDSAKLYFKGPSFR